MCVTVYNNTCVDNCFTVDKVFGMATGLGNMMFAFAYSLVLIEISETVREPAQATMRKAVKVSAVLFALYVGD